MSESNRFYVKSGKWPSGEGRAIALLRAPPEELGPAFRLIFRSGATNSAGLWRQGSCLPRGKACSWFSGSPVSEAAWSVSSTLNTIF